MSDSGTFTLQDVMNFKRQMDLANAVRGGGAGGNQFQPMSQPQQMLDPTGIVGNQQQADPRTPNAGLANAGGSIAGALGADSYLQKMGQMLRGLPVGSMSAQGFPDPNAGLLTRTQNYLGGLFNGG